MWGIEADGSESYKVIDVERGLASRVFVTDARLNEHGPEDGEGAHGGDDTETMDSEEGNNEKYEIIRTAAPAA